MSQPLCRHCHKEPASRPRGLGWKCYYTPGVRELYPSTSKFARRGLPDYHGGTNQPPCPTSATPGSLGKVEVLEHRARIGVSLWHPDDAPLDAESHRPGLLDPLPTPWPRRPHSLIDKPASEKELAWLLLVDFAEHK